MTISVRSIDELTATAPPGVEGGVSVVVVASVESATESVLEVSSVNP